MIDSFIVSRAGVLCTDDGGVQPQADPGEAEVFSRAVSPACSPSVSGVKFRLKPFSIR
jgi:hypothetical protein